MGHTCRWSAGEGGRLTKGAKLQHIRVRRSAAMSHETKGSVKVPSSTSFRANSHIGTWVKHSITRGVACRAQRRQQRRKPLGQVSKRHCTACTRLVIVAVEPQRAAASDHAEVARHDLQPGRQHPSQVG